MAKKILNRKTINPNIPIFTGEKSMETPSLQLFQFNENKLIEKSDYRYLDFKGFKTDDYQYWLNIHGLHDVVLMKNICTKIGIHDLVVQDILDVNQRPKAQEFDDYWFLTMKSITPSTLDILELEQFSFVLGKDFLVSFQERKADYFDHIRERLRGKIGAIRNRESDYLLYLLLESILDNYFKTINNIEKNMEDFGLIDINVDPSPHLLGTIEKYKRQIHLIKKSILPIRDFVLKIEREDNIFIRKNHLKYYYELKDLCLSLLDDCEQIDVRLESSTNMFFSIQGHRMNQIMKILTVISSIFIPLTFIAGVYGMNFSDMPELHWRWGYISVWVLMLMVAFILIIFFKRKKWF